MCQGPLPAWEKRVVIGEVKHVLAIAEQVERNSRFLFEFSVFSVSNREITLGEGKLVILKITHYSLLGVTCLTNDPNLKELLVERDIIVVFYSPPQHSSLLYTNSNFTELTLRRAHLPT